MYAIKRFLNKIRTFLRPAYWRERTGRQRRFDKFLKYLFSGSFVLIILMATVVPTARQFSPTQSSTRQEVAPEITIPKTPEEKLMFNVKAGKIAPIALVLGKKETLSGLLTRGGVSLAEALKIAKAMDLATDTRKLRPEQAFDLYFDANKVFCGLKMETKSGDIVWVFKDDETGEFIPQAQEGHIETVQISANGIVETTFSQAAEKAGIPKSITYQVRQALDGEIDFRTDVKPQALFSVTYEKKMTQTGREVSKSILLAVSLQARGKTYQRYYFVDAGGNPAFYNEYGESAPKIIAKRPLGKGRISSGFGTRRHPILHYQIHHAGVDFPAKTGTPIPAGADGVITQIGRNGAYGRYIRIRHTGVYSTAYAHLSGYAKNLRVGSRVKRGETIGYVGSSGRSTGPHLHYEVIKNGRQVNPLKTYTIPKKTLKNGTLKRFIETVKKVNPDFVYTPEAATKPAQKEVPAPKALAAAATKKK